MLLQVLSFRQDQASYGQTQPEIAFRMLPQLPKVSRPSNSLLAVCVLVLVRGRLHQLLQLPDFHLMLLDGLGLPGVPDVHGLARADEPFLRRCRRLWQNLQPPPPPSESPPVASPTPLDPFQPPNWRRYRAGSQIRLRSGAAEANRLEIHSACAQPLFGSLVRPFADKGSSAKAKPPTRVRQPSRGKHWSGKSAPSSAELSLRGGQPFVLYEYVEELPPLLLTVGMSHQARSYHVPPASQPSRQEGPGPLGPLGCRHPIALKDAVLPGIYSSKIRLSPGQGMSTMESVLQRAPLFRHSLKNKFLLVRSRGSGSWELYLRKLETCCLVGQVEPKKQVPNFHSKDYTTLRNMCIRQMYTEAKKKWQTESSGEIAGDLNEALFQDVAESVLQWWPEVQSARDELKEAASRPEPKPLAETVALLDAARRGQERLQALGIEIGKTDDKKLQKALLELEKLEKLRDAKGADSHLLFCARWTLEQLQLTPWHLTTQALKGRHVEGEKGSRSFAIVGPGDPSSCLEGVSFLTVSSKEIPECLQLAAVQRLSDSQLRRQLQGKFPHEMFEPLRRWDRIALLCRSTGEVCSVAGVTGWSCTSLTQGKTEKHLKRKHSSLLQEAFERQVAALSAEAVLETASEGDEQPELLDEEDWLSALPEGPGSSKSTAALFENPRGRPADSDQMELQKMRRLFQNDGPDEQEAGPSKEAPQASQASQVPAAESKREARPQPNSMVRVLKVITQHKVGAGYKEKIMYVVGEENIKHYRGLQAAQAQAQDAPRPVLALSVGTSGTLGTPSKSKRKTRSVTGTDSSSEYQPSGCKSRRSGTGRETKRPKTASASGAPSQVPRSEKSDSAATRPPDTPDRQTRIPRPLT